jgi:hypothetical protein
MGPAFETFITAAGIVLAVIVAAAFLGRPVWRRAWRFLCVWANADRLREEEERRQAAFREKARREVTEWTEPECLKSAEPQMEHMQEQENR